MKCHYRHFLKPSLLLITMLHTNISDDSKVSTANIWIDDRDNCYGYKSAQAERVAVGLRFGDRIDADSPAAQGQFLAINC